jgi:hypothetical protein
MELRNGRSDTKYVRDQKEENEKGRNSSFSWWQVADGSIDA